MLELEVKAREVYNEETQEFSSTKGGVIHLEHSLISVSKWEAKWHKPFIQNSNNMSRDEILDYIKFMTISTKPIDDSMYECLSEENVKEILAYIQNPMTATWFKEDKTPGSRSREIITSELIYYWMVALQIPFECQKWHLNRLLTLIRVCNVKNEEANPNNKHKMSKSALMSRNAALNAQRKAKLHTKG